MGSALEKVHFSFLLGGRTAMQKFLRGRTAMQTAKKLLQLFITRARPPAEAAEMPSREVEKENPRGGNKPD